MCVCMCVRVCVCVCAYIVTMRATTYKFNDKIFEIALFFDFYKCSTY